MAEFLIYNKDHWMDDLTPEQLNVYLLKYSNFQQKYNSRYQRGDIVEVRKDGFWGDGPYPRKNVFRVVRVPGMSLKEAQAYCISLDKIEFSLDNNGKLQYDVDGNVKTITTSLNRSKYRINSGIGKDVETVTTANLQITDKSLAVII